MRFNNPIPRGGLPQNTEASSLHSLRESQSVAHDWKRIRASTRRGNDITQALSQMQAALGKMQRNNLALSALHPFKIYTLPAQYRMKRDDGNFWRQYRVRNGLVLTASVFPGVEVDGTDLVDFPYDDVFVTDKTGALIDQSLIDDYQIPLDTPNFFFWVDVSTDGLSADLRYHTDPTQASYTDADGYNTAWTTTNAWTGWPVPDGTHFLLGWVDTRSRKAEGMAVVRQIQTTDIIASGGSCPF